MRWFGSYYFRTDEDKKHAWAAPLNEPDLTGLPEALIYTAGFDPLRDEGELYAEKLRKAGVPVTFKCFESLTHSFTMMGGVLPAAQRAMTEIADQLAAQFAS
jgi:acetyl esterase/lipase